jgi:alpha,alpha-trehalase
MRTALLLAAVSALPLACSSNRKTDAPVVPAAPREERRPLPQELTLDRDEARSLLCRVLDERDLDCDRRVTAEDERLACAARAPACSSAPGRTAYVVRARDVELTLPELHQASQLVQELALGLRSGATPIRLDVERVREKPGTYLRARIERDFWDALTRRIDAAPEQLLRAAADPKLSPASAPEPELCAGVGTRCAPKATPVEARPESPELFVYYPATDERARTVYRNAGIAGKLTVSALPVRPTGAWLRELTRTKRHGLLTLALDSDGKGRPFVVPGGRFNELYGWDSFFIVWGLVQTPARLELARSIVDNQAYEIAHYGKILNANRTYYLTRSQPPFFTSSIREVWQRLPASDESRRWLSGVLAAAIDEYRNVWSSPPRRIPVCEGDVCLARYFGDGAGEPPEVEPGHFDAFYEQHALSHGHCAAPNGEADRAQFRACALRVADRYRKGTLPDPLIDEFFRNDACMRESGHDTTYRFQVNGEERCTDYATVDLNALLFKTETDLATLIQEVFAGTFGG